MARPCSDGLTLIIFLSHHAPMIATLGEAHDLGLEPDGLLPLGQADAMKSRHECKSSDEVDLETQVWAAVPTPSEGGGLPTMSPSSNSPSSALTRRVSA
jgi:hypothetical protein